MSWVRPRTGASESGALARVSQPTLILPRPTHPRHPQLHPHPNLRAHQQQLEAIRAAAEAAAEVDVVEAIATWVRAKRSADAALVEAQAAHAARATELQAANAALAQRLEAAEALRAQTEQTLRRELAAAVAAHDATRAYVLHLFWRPTPCGHRGSHVGP